MTTRIDTNKWMHNISRNPKDVEKEYDALANVYDQQMRDKNYRPPIDTARILSRLVAFNQPVLDVACGTGLVAEALNKSGFSNLVGIDISSKSIKEAEKKGVYKITAQHDILKPAPFERNSFSAVIFIGVFSRFDDEMILYILDQYAQLVRAGGMLLFSHREDLMKKSSIIHKLNAHDHLSLEIITEPYPYIPGDPTYQNMGVHYVALKKLSL